MELAMMDDVIVPIAEAQVSAHDRGVYFGDGVYEAVRCCGGKLFAMDWHISRLANSLRQMDMLDKVDLELVRRRVDRVVAWEICWLHDSLLLQCGRWGGRAIYWSPDHEELHGINVNGVRHE